MEKIITRLQQLIEEVPKLIHQFSPAEMTEKPAPGKWSKKEIMGHLCDSALHNWQRFIYAKNTDRPFVITTYPQDELVQVNDYNNLPTGNILALWKNLNRQILAVFKNMPEEKLDISIQLPNGELNNLQFLINDYVVHLEHHLNQIFKQQNIVPQLPENWNLSVEYALGQLRNHPMGKPFVTLLENGEMYIEIYEPKNVDLQQPHDQDEIYVVISGSGIFYNNGERRPFKTGDLIFVPAGIEHRFEDFTDDFKTWVVFY
ncbi:MAG: DinB family protein [Bacteroidota bacterium]